MPYKQLPAIFSTPAFPEDVQRRVSVSVPQPCMQRLTMVVSGSTLCAVFFMTKSDVSLLIHSVNELLTDMKMTTYK